MAEQAAPVDRLCHPPVCHPLSPHHGRATNINKYQQISTNINKHSQISTNMAAKNDPVDQPRHPTLSHSLSPHHGRAFNKVLKKCGNTHKQHQLISLAILLSVIPLFLIWVERVPPLGLFKLFCIRLRSFSCGAPDLSRLTDWNNFGSIVKVSQYNSKCGISNLQ